MIDFAELFTLQALISLLTLILMEIALGIDNVIFVSIVMGRLPKEKRPLGRKIWMFAGMAVRIILLLCIGFIVKGTSDLFSLFGHSFSLRDLIMLGGGLFLLIKTTMEIHDKLEGDEEAEAKPKQNGNNNLMHVMGQIVLIDLVFSFDSIITAVGLAKQISVMIIAVIIAMTIMFFFSAKISRFIHAHPAFKMLALSFLMMVGLTLVLEGFKVEVPKGYVYFSMAFAFAVELLNMKVRKPVHPVELNEPQPEEE